MLTEQDRNDQEKSTIQERIDFNNQVIVAAAKYEREMSHKDFIEILADMRNVSKILENELAVLTKQIINSENPVDRETTQNEFLTKATRKMIIEEAVSYPERIIHQAALAKEENIELKNQLKEKTNV